MRFTSKNLKMVRLGINLAINEIHHRIAVCPSVGAFTGLNILEREKEDFEYLLARINRAIAQEDKYGQ